MDRVLTSGTGLQERLVIHAGLVTLEGDLSIPAGATSLVVFVHGSGSSRHSRRNKLVAQYLNEAGLATLLFDLLTEREEAADIQTARWRFDIGLLADRAIAATHWLSHHDRTRKLHIGYFGASTGAAAALVAAAQLGNTVGAVVSRGGRPDLVQSRLPSVKSPTLLIVGGNDTLTIDLNRAAFQWLQTDKDLVVVPDAGHVLEEPGKLEQVAELARAWFTRHLNSPETVNEG